MKYLSIITITLFLASCGGGEEKKADSTSEEKDTTETADTSTTQTEDVVEQAEENPEEVSIEEYEKANEGGMDFCDCVKKSKEFDDKMIAAETDEEMEAVMAEKDKFIDANCKVIKMGSQDSPDDRAARKRKIDACLKGL